MTNTFAYAVCIVLIANIFLSASALRCHQCNSHQNEDCATLVVNTPRGQRDEQYLTVCEHREDIHEEVFCRKSVLKFEVNDEHRIERGCGWIKERVHNACFTADNEGYKQTICTCEGDGCNGAISQLGQSQLAYSLSATALSLLISACLRR